MHITLNVTGILLPKVESPTYTQHFTSP